MIPVYVKTPEQVRLLSRRRGMSPSRALAPTLPPTRCSANIYLSRKSFHLTSLRLREAIFTPPSRWLRFWASLLRTFFHLRCLLASVEVFTRLYDMSFYDHLSFYLDNGVYHPGTGDSHRKRNIRFAAKKYFTKGL